MGLVSDAAVDLVVLNRVMQLREVIFVADVSGSCAGDAFDSLFLHRLGGWVGIFPHQDGIHLGPECYYLYWWYLTPRWIFLRIRPC